MTDESISGKGFEAHYIITSKLPVSNTEYFLSADSLPTSWRSCEIKLHSGRMLGSRMLLANMDDLFRVHLDLLGSKWLGNKTGNPVANYSKMNHSLRIIWVFAKVSFWQTSYHISDDDIQRILKSWGVLVKPPIVVDESSMVSWENLVVREYPRMFWPRHG